MQFLFLKQCSPTESNSNHLKLDGGHFILSLISLSSLCEHDVIKNKNSILPTINTINTQVICILLYSVAFFSNVPTCNFNYFYLDLTVGV